jgi:hypothetical protein
MFGYVPGQYENKDYDEERWEEEKIKNLLQGAHRSVLINHLRAYPENVDEQL